MDTRRSGDMGGYNETTMADLKRDIEELTEQRRSVQSAKEDAVASYDRQLADLSRKINSFNDVLSHYQDKNARKSIPVGSKDIRLIQSAGSQVEALAILARENGGRVKVSEVCDLLVVAGLMKRVDHKRAYGNTFNVLKKSKWFKGLGGGSFKLIKAHEPNANLLPFGRQQTQEQPMDSAGQ